MNANLPQPETPTNEATTEERLAKLTGFNSPSVLPGTSTPSGKTSPLLDDEDFSESLTRHSFASSPLSKLVFVAGAVFLVVFAASLFLSQFQSPGELVSVNKLTEAKKEELSPLLSLENQDKEKEELLAQLALREQQERIRDLEAQKAQKPQPTVLKQPQKPVIRTVAVRPTPVRQVVRQPPPRPQSVPVRYQQPIRPRTVVTPTRITPPQSPSADSTQLWTQLAQVGSFGGGAVTTSPSSNSERLIPQYKPKTVSTKVLTNNETPLPEPNLLSGNDYRGIPFGQSASAVLETTIAWEGDRGSRTAQTPDDRYIVTFNEPLKDKFGNLKIPAGSQLIVRLEGGNNALVNLTAESIVVEGIESKLPQGALKLRGVEGQPLIAEITTLGGNNDNDNTQALADLLSIAGDFANIPGSRSIDSLYRTVTGGRNRRSGSGMTATVFFLPEGIPLEVFVNKTFSLDAPEKPLELDLGGIELSENSMAIESTDTAGEN
jgi:hypothetical protein